MIAYIALGANIGDREEYLRKAVQEIQKKGKVLSYSSLYETEPVGYANQGWFLNAAVGIEISLAPEELLFFLLSIERELGRIRTHRNGPRTVDLDILFFGTQVIETKNLEVPHPRLHERAFVLVPLREIAPHVIHPKTQKTVQEILLELPEQEEVRLYKKEWL